MKSLLFVFLIFSQFILHSTVSYAKIANFHVVSEQIWRGGRPDYYDLKNLHDRGYKTIINIENRQNFVESERRNAERMGLQFISIPMDEDLVPNNQDIEKLLQLLSDKSNQPIFIHCFHGQDRTGLVIGLYRVLIEGWDAKAAHDEMLQLGFHTKFINMENYFWSKTKSP